ncbi:MAG: hypothetical protein ACJ77E_02925 [Gaiellaceae bacterium]
MARAALLTLLACLVLAPIARADGDPASDYLLTQPVFLPPDVVMRKSDAERLTSVTTAAKKAGYEIRVALIGTRYDMGSVGALYEKPQRYAVFLGQELRFVYKGRLLVVMPNGYGASQNGKPWPAADKVVAPLPPPGASGPALAAGAASAVQALAAASGVHVSASAGDASSSSSSTFLVLGAVVVVVLFAGGMGALLLVRRRRLAV